VRRREKEQRGEDNDVGTKGEENHETTKYECKRLHSHTQAIFIFSCLDCLAVGIQVQVGPKSKPLSLAIIKLY